MAASSKLTNSLLLAAINVALVCLAFTLFVFPRFTFLGGMLFLAILSLLFIDLILVLCDLCRSGTRVRGVVAVILWLPILFLFAMINQWEGPLFVAARGDPPTFELRGLAGVCGVEIYGPEQENAEWYGDDIGLLWKIDHTLRFPFDAKFKYGEVPAGFAQVTPISPPPLDPNLTYKLVLERCMGGPQYLSLHRDVITEYKPNLKACWGPLKVPGRENPALVRVDCKSFQPLTMSERAQKRLKEYRENRIPFY